ncbi:Bug family tripartite tricarboxylate transporter substrate binding protein [Roseomonas populi]|uniref:Tripartite tricarboxylate transporter substrate binding protein n=1 Tax=Roseomonas populi TaxID=3121582 RepID=A0ABT1XE35_9PROT|nr:tripartite tricarboxylate transporter substrate binding protein [Roseomonas pecuniae]MCR0985698.1 tripartite tricarboxylate transporter substrate binding protein [Roseomonas pecuniae]
MKPFHPTRRTALLSVLAAAAPLGALPLGGALAAYPDRPVRWIVGAPPGGGTDTVARVVAQALSARLGQPIVIENRPGASTTIGADAAAKAAPDGLTLATVDNGTVIFVPVLYRRLPFDPDKDFRPVGLMARVPQVLAVGPQSSIRTAKELVERAKAAPGKIDYASPGIGSPHHLTMERLCRTVGIQLNHVPYRGSAPALNDVIAGQVEVAVVDTAAGGEYLRSGRVRPLATCQAERLPDLANVPTVNEALELSGFDVFSFQALVVPRATPDAIVQRLSDELQAVLKDEAVRARMAAIGIQPLGGGPEDYDRAVREDREIWVPLIRSLGITLEL